MKSLPQVAERIQLTDQAAEAMKAALRKARATGIRINARGGKDGRTYRLAVADRVRGSEVVLERKGVLLYVSSALFDADPEVRIDYVRQDGRQGFTIQNLGGCGCGPGCACAA